MLGVLLRSTAPFARPRLLAEYLAHTEDRQQLSLSWRSRSDLLSDQLAFAVSSCPCSVGQGIGLLIASDHCRVPGTQFVAKSSNPCQPFGHSWYIEYSPSIESDLDSGQLFVETVVLTSLVTVAGLRVSASPAVSGLTVVGHRSTLELQQAPVRIQQTTTSSHKWDKVSLAQLIVPLVRLGSPRNRRVAIVPSELWGLCCTRLLSSQRWVGN